MELSTIVRCMDQAFEDYKTDIIHNKKELQDILLYKTMVLVLIEKAHYKNIDEMAEEIE